MSKSAEMEHEASPAWAALQAHAAELVAAADDGAHLRALLADEKRCEALALAVRSGRAHEADILFDFARQRLTGDTVRLLLELAREKELPQKIETLLGGGVVNATEQRAAAHAALRAPRGECVLVQGQDVVPGVHAVLDRIASFSAGVRSGQWLGATGKPLTQVVAIGIGGSFLGPAFVHTALSTCSHCPPSGGASPQGAAEGRELHFIANVDPVDCLATLEKCDPEHTLVVVVSKTFTTAETMLNARTVRAWLVNAMGESCIAKHVVAVSTATARVAEFGIDPANAFGFWDWVGGRFSVTSAVGVLPLSLQYGFEHASRFLDGARAMDEHFATAPMEANAPVLMALTSVWNVSFLGYSARAVLPYAQSLSKFPAHVQQLSMESNGKRVRADGTTLAAPAGEIEFGEAGTNGQHSFYQLLHQGRTVPAEFIGSVQSHRPVKMEGWAVSNHDELVANLLAQPDALAVGKTAEELRSEGCPEWLVPHKTFEGNRPSLTLLFPRIDAFTVGQLLALYEHRIAVQGMLWGVNSFDQWGVELGKQLATNVRNVIAATRDGEGGAAAATGFNSSTSRMLAAYLAQSRATVEATTTSLRSPFAKRKDEPEMSPKRTRRPTTPPKTHSKLRQE